MLSPHFDKVITFEPHPELFDIMRTNLQGCANVETYRFGLADKQSQGTLVMKDRRCGAQHIEFGKGDVQVIQLDSLELDALDYLSLDIEGAEPLALEGARGHIERFRPIIVVEQWRKVRKDGSRHPGHEANNYSSNTTATQWLVANGYRQIDRITQDSVFVPA